jgi:hypothetical protein
MRSRERRLAGERDKFQAVIGDKSPLHSSTTAGGFDPFMACSRQPSSDSNFAMSLYKAFDIWERKDSRTAVRYRCFESLETGKFLFKAPTSIMMGSR